MLPSGELYGGIDDHACAGAPQGANRAVVPHRGIRLAQSRHVERGHRNPAQLVSFRTPHGDPHPPDPAPGNKGFNGRLAGQSLPFEDYDGDGRDASPAVVRHGPKPAPRR